jgi:uncharacterized membrane protein YeaQ/YmgE (transglycosylase-associated protein family)
MTIDNPFFIGVLTGVIGGIISGWILFYSQIQTNNPISFIFLSCIVTILMLLFIGFCFKRKLKKKK